MHCTSLDKNMLDVADFVYLKAKMVARSNPVFIF